MASTRYRFGRFKLLPGERQLLADARAVHLGAHAFDVLVVLVEGHGKLVTKDELLARVWPRVVVEENTLQVHVAALRKVLGAETIATVSGRGYRFVLPVADDAGPPEPTQHNLPHQLTSFIGRERQIEEVAHLLSTTRLLTLTGAGGCGKTRLALKVAEGVLDSYEDVRLVELASLGDPTLVPHAVASALEVKEQAGKQLVDVVADWLGARHLLLVLDNAEHLLSACAQFADQVLRRCAPLVVLVTSRERLGIAGELTYRVPSLSVPDLQQDIGSEDVLGCEAAQLFIERARLQRPDFTVTARDTAALVSICRRLDGIALAIELAAPRVRTLSIDELSQRIDQRFSLLTGGSRTALPRHRTLRSLIDWSYDLLTDGEKTVLRQASVFAGGWTLEAAESVCSGSNLEPGEVLDLMTALTDKSLFTADTRNGTTRFGMLETVRHYAQDQLRESGEDAALRERHLAYFTEVVDRLSATQTDADRQVKLTCIDKEHDNLRAAMAWCEADASRVVQGLSMAGKLFWFWRTRGYFNEGRAWITRLLALAPKGERERAHGSANGTAGALAFMQSDYAAAEAHQRECLAIGRELGRPQLILSALGNLGSIALARSEHAAARSFTEQSLAIAREIADPRSIAVLLQNLGALAHLTGDLGAAQVVLEEGVLVSRAVGKWSEAEMLGTLARVRHALGDNAGARTLMTDSLAGQRAFENKAGVAKTLVWLAAISHDLNDVPAAKAQLAEALPLLEALSADRMSLASGLEATAGLLLDFARPTDAARVWGYAQRLREDLVMPQGVPERDRYQVQVARARSTLQDDASFDLHWSEGRSWRLGEAVQYARALLDQSIG